MFGRAVRPRASTTPRVQRLLALNFNGIFRAVRFGLSISTNLFFCLFCFRYQFNLRFVYLTTSTLEKVTTNCLLKNGFPFKKDCSKNQVLFVCFASIFFFLLLLLLFGLLKPKNQKAQNLAFFQPFVGSRIYFVFVTNFYLIAPTVAMIWLIFWGCREGMMLSTVRYFRSVS